MTTTTGSTLAVRRIDRDEALQDPREKRAFVLPSKVDHPNLGSACSPSGAAADLRVSSENQLRRNDGSLDTQLTLVNSFVAHTSLKRAGEGSRAVAAR